MVLTSLPAPLASNAAMSVRIDITPNPNALKFSVGVPVGGPATFAAGQTVDEKMPAALLAIAGVVSVFLTADFVTLSKETEAEWDNIVPLATEILEAHFG